MPDPDLIRFRMRLIREEYEELMRELGGLLHTTQPAVARDRLRKVLQESVDLCYVAEGTAVSLGLPFDEAFAAVHRSNMTKSVNPTGGKAIKGEGYVEADMELVFPNHIEHKEATDHG